MGQNWIIQKVTSRLSKDLHTKVEIKHVDFTLFNNMHLLGLLVEDRQKDTLLYAGEVRVRVSDWFFVKKNIQLKYVGLANAVIKTQRTSPEWNYQFLLDYFTSPDVSSANNNENSTQLSLEKIELKNFSFLKKDAWLGQDMVLAAGSLQLITNEVNLQKKNIDLSSLVIDHPYFSLYNYNKLKPKSDVISTHPNTTTPDDSDYIWNKQGWVIKANKLELTNGTFRNDAYTLTPESDSFDGRHINFGNINAVFTNIQWEKDTVTTHLRLQTKERSGFEVKSLLADVKMTPVEMAFSNLEIQTNNSSIGNFFRMRYDDMSSMNDFIHKVKMQGNFNNSKIDSDDIAFFAPALKTWKKSITLNGSVRGTVEDFVGKNLEIKAGNNTSLNGDISMTGLPDINQTFIDFKANDFRTTYDDALSFVPALQKVNKPSLRQLQYLRFNGSFTGFIRDFVTFGTMHTQLGVITSDLNMKLPSGSEPVYSGSISTSYFKLGEFIKDKNIGSIALEGIVRGKGFNDPLRQIEADGKIHFFDYKGYRYDNLAINGRLDKNRFEGVASIDDEEAELTLNGVIDFNKEIPTFNFLADITKANLKNLNLVKEDISFGGKLNLNFTGSNIDNFMGYANISQAVLTKSGNPLPFDSLVITSKLINNKKTITANSNEFDATISGDFNIRNLPDAVRLFLNKYYPAYIKAPQELPGDQSLSFDISTRTVDDYIKLINKRLSGFNHTHITGNLDTRIHELSMLAEIPQFKYSDYQFDNTTLTARGSKDSLTLNGSMANTRINENLNIPLTEFRIKAQHDISDVRINSGTAQTVRQADIHAKVFTYQNGVKIEFDPSVFSVNGKVWTIEETGELEFRKNIPASGQLVLKENSQEVRMRTRPSETGDWNDLVIESKKLNIGDFAPFFLPQNRLEGLLTGSILIEDPINNPYITTSTLLAESVRLDNDSIGDIKTNLIYDNKTKQLKAKGGTVDEPQKLAFELDVHVGNPEQQENNLVALATNNFEVKILERFLGSLFSDMQGYVTGNFDLRGAFSHLNITGKGHLTGAGLKVNFTQCFYKIQDTDIELKPGEIDFDGIVLTDPSTGNPIYLRGGIVHDGFKDMFFDLSVSTRKPNTTSAGFNKPVLILNTTFNDNKQFYGRVKGTGSFSLLGPQSDIYMKIDAIASTTDSSMVVIPPTYSRESGIADFLVEKTYGREMVDSNILNNTSNIVYDVDLTANPMVTVKLILDDLTGDEINGNGSGSLNIRSGTNEKLSMRGRFDIEKGDYLFTFQSVFKKPFKIRAGTTNYITWSGDPYDAKIRFEAVYTADNVSFAPLTTILPDSYTRLREDVYVIAILTGSLFKPDFKFNLDFPANSKVKSNFAVASQIQQMEKNENEINRQVAYLIVLNSFAPPESGPTNTGLGTQLNELTYNTISSLSSLFFNEINRKLNSELSKILKTDNISINFSGSVYNRNLLSQQSSGNFNINQSDINVNVPISMFKDRFVLTLGSTLDVPLQTTIQQNVQFLPDVTAEWLINESGTVRVSFFYRQNLDYLTTSSSGAARTKRSGANISYRKEFETIAEFFGKKKNIPLGRIRKTSPAILKPEPDEKTKDSGEQKK